MHRVGCLGWTSEDTSKEAKLHGRQCPSSCVFRLEFPRLSPDAPKRGYGYCSSPFPRGKSNALSPAVNAEKQFTPSHTSSCHRQNGENYSIIPLLSARGRAKNRASTKTRGFQTILPRKPPRQPTQQPSSVSWSFSRSSQSVFRLFALFTSRPPNGRSACCPLVG